MGRPAISQSSGTHERERIGRGGGVVVAALSSQSGGVTTALCTRSMASRRRPVHDFLHYALKYEGLIVKSEIQLLNIYKKPAVETMNWLLDWFDYRSDFLHSASKCQTTDTMPGSTELLTHGNGTA